MLRRAMSETLEPEGTMRGGAASDAKLFGNDFCLGVLGRAAGRDGLASDAASEFEYKWVRGTPR